MIGIQRSVRMAWPLQTPSVVRRSLLLSLLGLSVLAGCDTMVAGEDEVGSEQKAIVNGTADATHLAVGVLHSGGTNACTATLIGSRTLLTAAHCVASETAPHTLLSPINFYPDGFNGQRIAAVGVTLHPDFAGANKADLAVVHLAEAVDATPARLGSQAPRVGEGVDLVGFGKTGENSADFGTRREADSTVGLIDSETMRYFGASSALGNLCNGDSGGPTFATRNGKVYLVGVHSSKGGSCGQEGNDMRVDSFLSWIVDAAGNDTMPAPEPGATAQQLGAGQGGPGTPTADQQTGEAGCSVGGSATNTGLIPVLLLGLLGALIARRRSR
jgi:MYXO-CTERM domain-containing protein